ncbi:MAG: PACE efflux transporter, partial [Shewanella sp.]|nr:PACE efflux transporter [Shewanella sp.]
MKTTERIFNALLFEAIALAIIIPVSALISGKGTSELVIVGIALSLYTVVWNYFYNLGFDRVFGANREQRTLKTRILHTFGFEGGLIFISIPTIAWFLQIGWLAAMGLEAVFLIFFFFYSTLFHW